MTDRTECVQCGQPTVVTVGRAAGREACRTCQAVIRCRSAGRLRLAARLGPLDASALVRPVFRQSWWRAAYRRRLDHALSTVPLYRERSAPWQPPAEPLTAEDLELNEYRICPFSRPWNPRREPSLWTGRPEGLSEVLRTTRALRAVRTVLEFREALVDWPRLGLVGYGTLLSDRARVRSDRWRLYHNLGVLDGARGPVAIVGGSVDLESLRSGMSAGPTAPITWLACRALGDGPGTELALVRDRHLGYVAARDPRCGAVHVNWRSYYVRPIDGGLVWTDLRRSRPTLVDVYAGPGWKLATCPEHRVPALVP